MTLDRKQRAFSVKGVRYALTSGVERVSVMLCGVYSSESSRPSSSCRLCRWYGAVASYRAPTRMLG